MPFELEKAAITFLALKFLKI